MTWFTDSVLGTHRKEALAKLPAELVSLMHAKDLTSDDVAILEEKSKLPVEMLQMVKEYLGPERQHLPMSVEEARDHREKLMQERSAYVKTSEDDWYSKHYNFCEH
jgi:FtsZ-binding cell division protein ZapB